MAAHSAPHSLHSHHRPGQKNVEENEINGFHVSTGAVCALDYTLRYQIAIAASSQPGYHTILVKTTA